MSEKTDQILAPNKLKIHKWKVREGFFVSVGNIVMLYESVGDPGTSGIQRLKSTKAGIVFERLLKEGQTCDEGQPILSLRECSHTTVMKDLCAECGADLQQNEDGSVNQASVPMIHSVPELKVTEKLAQKLGKADSERLLCDKKLVLLVDLDQTVVHTTNDNVPNNLKDVYHFQLYGPNSPWYHTRLRPGALDFLKRMHEFYELHICTFGARNYAHTIAQFLDENGRLFSQRILSRDECFNATSKTDNLKALFPCGDSMVCIIDDREDVWNCVTNLIQVKPYHFFQHTGDINAPPALAKHELDGRGIDFMKDISSISHIEKLEKACEDVAKENGVDDEVKSELSSTSDSDKIINVVDDNVTDTESLENQSTGEPDSRPEIKPKIAEPADNMIVIEDPDDYLMYLEHILIQIHERFYDIYEKTAELPDLKSLIPKVKSEVLVGKNLVFSGLVPNNQRLVNSRPYLVAMSLGANVTQELEATTTHLIAATAGTFKVNNARKRTDISVVTPDWLWTCAERWEACDERLFPLLGTKNSHKMRQPPLHCQSPEHMVNYGETSKSGASTEDELKFVDTINPLLSFSNADLDDMNKEFDQFFESDDSSSSNEPVDMENPPMQKALKKRKRAVEKEEKQFFNRAENKEQAEKLPIAATREEKEEENKDSSEDEELPSTKFRRGEIPGGINPNSDDDTPDIDNTYDDEADDDGQWNMMGAALEREFLGLE